MLAARVLDERGKLRFLQRFGQAREKLDILQLFADYRDFGVGFTRFAHQLQEIL